VERRFYVTHVESTLMCISDIDQCCSQKLSTRHRQHQLRQSNHPHLQNKERLNVSTHPSVRQIRTVPRKPRAFPPHQHLEVDHRILLTPIKTVIGTLRQILRLLRPTQSNLVALNHPHHSRPEVGFPLGCCNVVNSC